MTLLEIDHVSKTYRNGVRANDDVSLAVRRGEVFGLLGPNGAGKTTLVGQVLGLLRPDQGRILLDGVDIVAAPEVARRRCGFQPQAAAPVQGLSPREAIEIVGRVRGGDPATVRRRARDLLAALDLEEVADRVTPMSGGIARLTGFCMAAVMPGDLVVLDEPTNDVDPLRRRALWSCIRALADSGCAVALVTHNVLEAERSVDRLAIIAAGRVQACGTPSELKSALGAPLRLELTREPGRELPAPPDGVLLGLVENGRSVALVEDAAVAAAVAWAQEAQTEGLLAEFALTPASLEEVYASWVSEHPQPA